MGLQHLQYTGQDYETEMAQLFVPPEDDPQTAQISLYCPIGLASLQHQEPFELTYIKYIVLMF